MPYWFHLWKSNVRLTCRYKWRQFKNWWVRNTIMIWVFSLLMVLSVLLAY